MFPPFMIHGFKDSNLHHHPMHFNSYSVYFMGVGGQSNGTALLVIHSASCQSFQPTRFNYSAKASISLLSK